MSRQSEIEGIERLLNKQGVEDETWWFDEIAQYLVDNGIGTKDRFEIGSKSQAKDGMPERLRYIKPIDYNKGAEDEG